MNKIVIMSACLLALSPGILFGSPFNPGDTFISVFNEATDGVVYRINNGGDFSSMQPFATGLRDPIGMAFSPDGRLFVVENGSGEVTDITAGGDFTSVVPFASGLTGPRGLLIDKFGRMLVAERSTGRVIDVSSGGDVANLPVFAQGLNLPRDIIRSGDGRLLITEEGSGEVTDISGGGDFTGAQPFASGLSTPYGLTQSPDGQIYVSEIFNGRVLNITGGGTNFATFAFGLVNVDEIAFDGEGRLLAVQEFDNSVVDISNGGDFSNAQPFAWNLGNFPQQIATARAQIIIADHTSTDITQIPEWAILQAKKILHIGYGHTSHGSQLTSGMSGLIAFADSGGLGLALPEGIFAWNNGGTDGALDLQEGDGYGTGWLDHDCGYYPEWINETRDYLDDPSHSDVNVIIWSWSGQVSGRTEQEMISTYLLPMSQLEAEYPHVTFVYMTGHADGTGQTGNLHVRNQQIKDYCLANGKVLYDFYDIECYDPDGNYYCDKNVNDNCDYDSDGNGSLDANWAIGWQNSHTEGVDWYRCSSAHSQPLNANRKAYAAWWLWARIAGWDPTKCAEDLDQDGDVDGADLGLFRSNSKDVALKDLAVNFGKAVCSVAASEIYAAFSDMVDQN